ncbi:hypothetical protein ACQKWADRAFT_137897 [Trichoderma austrokoningii]
MRRLHPRDSRSPHITCQTYVSIFFICQSRARYDNHLTARLFRWGFFFPSCDLDPWTQAYEIFQDRESELASNYKRHLASLQIDTVSSADLSTPLSVGSIVKRLLAD